MLIQKNKPVSIDIPIQAFQKKLYNKLKALWPVDDTTMDGHGKVYRNANDQGYVPEYFLPSATPESNTIYEQVRFDKTRQSALFFFDEDDQAMYKEGYETARVSLIFITNIAKLKPNIQHRGDQEVMNDVQAIVSLNFQNFILTSSETGFKNVFRSFTGLVNKDGEVFEDRHPLFCFRFNFELFYDPTQISCK